MAERALNAEMDHHLGGAAAEGRSNSRNGYGRKTVLTETGKLPIAVPRDRLATFEPQLIAKCRRRLPGFDDKVISMYARGLSVRRIVYTTNAIEALNAKLRRAVRTRGHFPSDEAALKLLYLVLNLAEREWRMPPREWGMARAQLAILFDDRFQLA